MHKFLISIFVALFACTNTTVAQVTISRSELVGTKWQPSAVYESHSSEYSEFTKDAFIWHCENGTTLPRPFYLSTTIPEKFDSTKVGVSSKGCYYNEYVNKDHFCCFAILSFDKSNGIMVLDLKNEPFIGPTTITYIRIDKK